MAFETLSDKFEGLPFSCSFIARTVKTFHSAKFVSERYFISSYIVYRQYKTIQKQFLNLMPVSVIILFCVRSAS